MEYYVLDSNIFFGDWYMQKASFLRFASYLERTGGKLLLSKVVMDEVQNLYSRELTIALSIFENKVDDLSSFFRDKIELKLDNTEYHFDQALHERFKNTIVFDYKDIDNEELVMRAIKSVMPFRANEKGFRDSLIWLSLLDHLKKHNIKDDVVFITKNYTDYFDKDSANFKQELQEDIKRYDLSCKLVPYLNLDLFIKKLNNDEKAGEDQSERIQEMVYENERAIEADVEFSINRLSEVEVQKLFGLKRYYSYIENLIEFQFIIHEGTEDIEIIYQKQIKESQYYVTCKFELRICELLLGIPEKEYYRNKEQIDKDFVDIYFAEGDYAYFSKYIRPAFTTNFIVDLESETIAGTEIIETIFTVK